MNNELVMPQLGLTMTEGKVLRWYKNVGDPFTTGEPLYEVETDKVNMDVEATDSGQLTEIVAALDQMLPIKTVIARYQRAGQAGVAEAATAAPDAESQGRLVVSPRARKLAESRGVDLSRVKGTGPGGRIVERDVLAQPAAAPPVAAAPAPPAPAAEPVRASQPAPVVELVAPPPVPVVPAVAVPVQTSRLRAITAERMTQSFQSAPHFYLTREVDAGELLSLKRTLTPALKKRGMVDLSITDFLLKAMALAIADQPAVNASWAQGGIHPNATISLGVAAAVEDGLLVPVVRNAQNLSLTAMAKERARLVDRARDGKLGPDDFGGASATLSNLGMYGVDHFQAILNPPESMIVAAGRIRERVVAVNGTPTVRPTMYLTITADHRVLDGAAAARFLGAFADMLETPGLLLISEGLPDAG